MKNSQKGFVVPLIIAIAVLVIGGGVYYFSKNKTVTPTSYKDTSLLNTYKVLSDENSWKTKLVITDNPEIWAIPGKNIAVKVIESQDNFYCGDKEANFVKYSSFKTGSIGGWGKVSIVDCGSYYFVYEFSDSGPKLYGPFETNSANATPINNVVNNSNTIDNTSVAVQDAPKSFLTQMKNDLQVASLVQVGNKDINAYQLGYSQDENAKVTLYLNSKLNKLWVNKDGTITYVNPYLQCFVAASSILCANYVMESGAMRPTFTQGKVLKTTDPSARERGDVIIFAHVTARGEQTLLTKRIVALPGESIRIFNGTIYINGVPLKNVGPIIVVKPETANQSEIKLATGQYFVLGDFTEQSYDSRAFGPMNVKDLLAKVIEK